MLFVSITSFNKAFGSVCENSLYGAAWGRRLLLFCAWIILGLALLLFFLALILSRLVNLFPCCFVFFLLLLLLLFLFFLLLLVLLILLFLLLHLRVCLIFVRLSSCSCPFLCSQFLHLLRMCFRHLLTLAQS